jgi:hypothetical protein
MAMTGRTPISAMRSNGFGISVDPFIAPVIGRALAFGKPDQ